MIIKGAKRFADYANEKFNLHVIYLDKKEVTEINVDDSVPTPGCLSVHHVKCVTENLIDTYKNSNYKKHSEIVKSIEYKEDQEQSSEVSTEITQNILDNTNVPGWGCCCCSISNWQTTSTLPWCYSSCQ